jgi:hypothetical protein
MVEWLDYSKEFLFGGLFGALAFGVVLLTVLFAIAVYVYHAVAWYEIGRKQKYKNPWLAWIPFANISMVLQMGGFHWAWVFLIIVPIAGWIALCVLFIISAWKVFEKERYPGWFSLSLVIPRFGGILYLVAIGFVAWGKGMTPAKKPLKKRK